MLRKTYYDCAKSNYIQSREELDIDEDEFKNASFKQQVQMIARAMQPPRFNISSGQLEVDTIASTTTLRDCCIVISLTSSYGDVQDSFNVCRFPVINNTGINNSTTN